MTVLLDAPLTTDEPDDEPAVCGGCGNDDPADLLPGPSGDKTCRGCLREWADNPDSPYFDIDD